MHNDLDELKEGKQIKLSKYFRIPRMKKLEEDETFLEEWLEPSRTSNL